MKTLLLRIVFAALILLASQFSDLPARTAAIDEPSQAAAQADSDAVAQAARQAIAQAYPQGLEKAVADARLSQARGEGPRSMPPHPSLKEKIKRGEANLPAFTDQVPSFGPGLGKGPSLAPLSGTVRVLVILVDFSDKVRTVSASYFDSLMFAAPVAGRGSVRDYFSEVSYGQVDIVTANLPSSMGWVRAPNNRAYYVNNGYCTDGAYPNNCRKLAEDLIDAVNPVVNFANYDNDNDGYTEPVMIVHSGQGAELTNSPTDIWSHAWWLYNFRTYDGKTIRQYTIQPEYWLSVNSSTSDMTIGVFAHEMGHGFWYLPDLYDTDYSSEGVGDWSLMAGGSWNGSTGLGDSPAWPDAWSRIQMGFTTPTEVVANTNGLSLPQAYNNGSTPTVFKLGSTVLGADEYFLLENREKTLNSYDQYLPGQGLLIWHVDEAKSDNASECLAQPHSSCGSTHYQVALEQADGLRHLEYGNNRGDAFDVFSAATNNTWNRTSNPESSSWYTSSDTFITVTSISAAGSTMTANVTTGLVVPSSLNATIPIAGQAALTWTDGSADETNFRVERSTDGGSFVEIGTAAKNATSYTDTTITCGHSYTYRVRAYRNEFSGQYTPYSNTAAVNPGACLGPFNKTAPANGATGLAINGLGLSWGSSSGATSYEYCFDTTSNNICNSAWTSTGAATGAMLNGLTAGTTYYWQVRSRNAGGTLDANGGWWSFTTTALPGAFVKSTPSNGTTGRAINGLILSWGPSSGATSYEYCYDTTAGSTCEGAWTGTGANTSATLNGLTAGTMYFWQVRANNASGSTYADTSTWWNFTTLPLPGSFNKSTPANAATGQAASFLGLSWGASANATGYEYCYDTSNDSNCSGWASTGTTTSATINGLTPGATYYWQVRANNASGSTNANTGAWWSFTTLPLPGAFNKSAPANGATGQAINNLSLSWAASMGSTGYQFCYDTTNDTNCDGGWLSSGTSAIVVVSGLTPGTTYYWHARANNDSGSTYSNSNTWWSFTTLPLPGTFTKSAPANTAAGQPTNSLSLSWGTSSAAAGYAYCFDTTNDSECTNWTSTGTTTGATINSLAPGTTYYWQVRASNASGSTDANSGAWWSFTTLSLPGSFNKTSPANGASGVNINNLTFNWGTSTGAAGYEFCYDQTNDSACTNWLDTGPTTGFTANGLTPGVTYYWQVRAYNASGDTYANSSAWWSFTTLPAPGAFSKSAPSNGATGQNVNSLVLSWGSSANAAGYEYCYDTVENTACDGNWTSAGVTTSATISALSPNTTYYWQVRATNSSATTAANGGAWWNFTTLPLPGAFAKSVPADGATGQVLNGLQLDWATSANAATYEYCYDTTDNNTCGVNWTSVSAAGATLNGLSSNTTYFWQVRARNAAGTTEADGGVWRSFTTISAPAFSKINPTSAAVDQPIYGLELSWGAYSQAQAYEYCYDTTDDDACEGDWLDAGQNTSVTLDGLLANTTYYWQVRAIQGLDLTEADNSTWWSFTTAYYDFIYLPATMR